MTGNPSYGDARRAWHPNFLAYMESIVDHPAYAGMPCTRDEDGKIDWTIPSNRPRGSKNSNGNRLRREWWADKAHQIGVPVEGKWLSQVAKTIHPFGRKPCQTCGRVMELAFVYPTRRTVQRLCDELGDPTGLAFENLLTVDEVVDVLFSEYDPDTATRALHAAFRDLGTPGSAAEFKMAIRERHTARESRALSPGVMSNAPDRLDGFHTYNLCCRQAQDLGRASTNMSSYSVDRRAFEQWSEGNWAVADRVMSATGTGTCPSCGADGPLTADHIGPISLGFAHSAHFRPACRRCNSAKNNRMSAADVRVLIELEKAGEHVASWQIRPLWDRLKGRVKDDSDALLLSKLLRIQQHHYLQALSLAVDAGVPDVLIQFLHPEHALARITLVGFDSATLRFERIEYESRQDTYARQRAGRMVRVAFDALRRYAAKPHRNIQAVDEERLREPLGDYQVALEAAQAGASPAREALKVCLGLHAGEADRDERFRLAATSDTDQASDELVRERLAQLLDSSAEVLEGRYERGEAVGWDDLDDLL